MQIRQFLRRYNLNLLPVAHPDIVPGAVLTKKRGFTYWGHLSELLTGPPGKYWSVEMDPANIIDGTVERSISLKGKSSLKQMGVNVEGGLERARSVNFSVSAVRVKTFRNGPGHASMLSLIPKVRELRKRNKSAWKLINNKRVVLETYYASAATVTFKTSGSVNLKAAVNAAGGAKVDGGGTVKWTGNRSFRIARSFRVPFAFRGWVV